jgi:hypothetical protein
MIFKRIISIALCICVLLSFAACGNSAKNSSDDVEIIAPTDNQNDNTEQVTPGPDDGLIDSDTDLYISDKDGNLTNIRKNGKLPSSKKDLTDEEIYYYIGTVVQAAIDLDINTLKMYSANEEDIKTFEAIINNPTYKEMYEKNIGNIIYLDNSHYFVYKDPFYIYSRWFSDEKVGDSKAAIDKLTITELNNIYNKYRENAVYIVNNVNKADFNFSLKNGHIYFELDGIFGNVGYDNVSDLISDDPSTYANIVFGTHRTADTNITNSDLNGIVDMLTSENLNQMIEYVNNNAIYDLNFENKELELDDCYQLYYKNKENREKIEAWMKDNTETYKNDCGIIIYIKANIHHKCNWPFNLFTDLEREQIKELPIYVDLSTSIVGSIEEWAQYYSIVQQMIYAGDIEDLYD